MLPCQDPFVGVLLRVTFGAWRAKTPQDACIGGYSRHRCINARGRVHQGRVARVRKRLWRSGAPAGTSALGPRLTRRISTTASGVMTVPHMQPVSRSAGTRKCDINPSQLPDRQQAKGDALESIATQISANCNASYVKGNDQCVGVPEIWGRNPMQFRLAKIVFASAGWRQSNAQQSRATSRPPADFHSRSQQSLKRAESSSWPENATH